VPELPDVNPNVAQLYRRKVKRPAEELAQDPSSQEPVIALRSLIGEVVLTHAEKRGVPSAHVGHAEEADVVGLSRCKDQRGSTNYSKAELAQQHRSQHVGTEEERTASRTLDS
jgi:hypothetical protein